ncbi:uncharacterized protein BXZ73DRAFT_75426 [Epithele typhae]|uniref:uncharacterized protein n=1 Tax=Epithele typhae TaxID=378194 RepID=UPI00200846FF|nr:uncharacterized protein BXZ73DRAFT_75426 [Epithele typhae]KAH9940905.1 hypothetical protein BXZ73DRAFT_75426 [Epithele typhae]
MDYVPDPPVGTLDVQAYPDGRSTNEISVHPLKKERRLFWLEIAMRHARDRLRTFPCTFSDTLIQVRATRRYWLMARTFLDYHDAYLPLQDTYTRNTHTTLMGAFSSDPGYMRSDTSILPTINIHAVVELTPPPVNLVVDHPVEYALYHGIAGPNHLHATARGGHTYEDVSRAPLLAVNAHSGYSPPETQRAYKKGTVNLGPSSDLLSAWGSKTGPTRTTKMKAGKRMGSPQAPRRAWGYWIPEPAMLLRATTEERRGEHLINWLRSVPRGSTSSEPPILRILHPNDLMAEHPVWVNWASKPD